MNEGQNGTGGLNANGNAGGFFVPGNSMAPTGLSALPNGSDSVVYVGDNGKQRKSKKWLIGAILVGVLLIAAVIFVVVKHTDIVDKIVYGGKMSNEELVEKIDQVNLDLNILTEEYNRLFSYDGQNQDKMLVMASYIFDEMEPDYTEVETELSELPKAEGTRLDEKKKQDYTEVYDSLWERYNIAKDGVALARRFNEAFFWPIASAESDDNRVEPVGQEPLINSGKQDVAKVAKDFNELYQLTQNGIDVEAVNNFFGTHDSIIVDYYNLFVKIDDPNAFYNEVNSFVKGVEK